MAEMKKLNDEALDQVSGGAKRRVDTGSSKNAVIRSGPGLTFDQVDSIRNGRYVYTTGESVENFEDGREWFEIYEPVHGWIAGSLIGY